MLRQELERMAARELRGFCVVRPALGALIHGDTPEEFAALLRKDHERWSRVFRTAGVKAE